MFGWGTYALNAAKIQRFRPMHIFLDTKFRFRTYVPTFSDQNCSLTQSSDQSFFLIIYVFLIHLFLFL